MIIDYEKLHKITITKLQQMVNSGKITVEIACGICADFVPESTVYEDERIRKALKEYFINSFQINGVAAICGVHIKDILAWLEKQGKQKPWSEEDKSWFDEVWRCVSKEYPLANSFIFQWLKSLRGRFTWKPSNEQMDVLLSEVGGWTKGCPKQIVLESLYNDLKKLMEE